MASQELGLLAVIALMIGVLSLLGVRDTVRSVHVSPSDTITESADAVALARPGEHAESFFRAQGWRVVERERDGVTVRSIESVTRGIRFGFNERFFNTANLVGVAKDASFIAVMAVGMVAIIILGGIDLSVGSIYALSGVAAAAVLARLAESNPGISSLFSIPVGVAVAGAVGSACGVVNGAATVGLRVHPFIITLGGMAVYRGVAFVATDGQSISGLPDSYTSGGFKANLWGANPVPMLIMVVVAIVGAMVLSLTVLGRRTFAIGGNETAARYAGIPVGRVKIVLFTLCGTLAGFAAAINTGYYGSASSGDGSGYELRVIAAAVVGGASLSGGRGSAIGATLGAVIIQLIDNGIVVLGVDSNYTNIVIGLAIVAAVVIDQVKHRWATVAR
ncbi:MAG: ABC transporter permease [Phycisphaerae bacterium]|nr:ABC transporter permease [Phycisphaerae bacterium]